MDYVQVQAAEEIQMLLPENQPPASAATPLFLIGLGLAAVALPFCRRFFRTGSARTR